MALKISNGTVSAMVATPKEIADKILLDIRAAIPASAIGQLAKVVAAGEVEGVTIDTSLGSGSGIPTSEAVRDALDALIQNEIEGLFLTKTTEANRIALKNDGSVILDTTLTNGDDRVPTTAAVNSGLDGKLTKVGGSTALAMKDDSSKAIATNLSGSGTDIPNVQAVKDGLSLKLDLDDEFLSVYGVDGSGDQVMYPLSSIGQEVKAGDNITVSPPSVDPGTGKSSVTIAATGLVKISDFNTKVTEIEGSITGLGNSPTISANDIPSILGNVKSTDPLALKGYVDFKLADMEEELAGIRALKFVGFIGNTEPPTSIASEGDIWIPTPSEIEIGDEGTISNILLTKGPHPYHPFVGGAWGPLATPPDAHIFENLEGFRISDIDDGPNGVYFFAGEWNILDFVVDMTPYAKVSDLGSLTIRVGTLEGKMTTVEEKVSTLEGKMTTAEGNISDLQSDVSDLRSDVTDLQTDLGTLEATVGGLDFVTGITSGVSENTQTLTVSKRNGSTNDILIQVITVESVPIDWTSEGILP